MPEGVRTAMYWVLGIGVIALIGLVMLILFGNLSGNVGFDQDSEAVINNTVPLTSIGFKEAIGRVNPSLASIVMTNASDGVAVTSDNYTVSGAVITAVGGASYEDQSVNVTATLSYDEAGKVDTENLIGNYTASVVNVSKQFPTTGTIIGIALLLVVLLGILIFAIKKMLAIAGGGGGGFGGSSSRKFKGGGDSDFA